MGFKDGELLVLIGAGCSKDAQVNTSEDMSRRLEAYLEDEHKPEWHEFRKLYYLAKSATAFSDGIRMCKPAFDIERLARLLAELEKKETSDLYPFIGSWTPRLVEVAGADLSAVRSFRRKILRELVRWVQISDYSAAAYYSAFYALQKEYEFPLRVFSLNYDICFEHVSSPGGRLEMGFDPQTRVTIYRAHPKVDAMSGSGRMAGAVPGRAGSALAACGCLCHRSFVSSTNIFPLFHRFRFPQCIVTFGAGYSPGHCPLSRSRDPRDMGVCSEGGRT